MHRYDPDTSPKPSEWLALGEDERIQLVERYHKRCGEHGESLKMHAVIHTVVETQLAERVSPVMDAFQRLSKDGLNRHESIHAIGSVLAEYIWVTLCDQQSDNVNEEYFDNLSKLTKASWETAYGNDA